MSLSMNTETILNNSIILKTIAENTEKVLFGKRDIIELALCSILCKGHVLIEDVPGVGKTSLASALARSFSCSFRRIQFTPDIMPSDITGFSMYSQKTAEFEYKEGLVMSNIVLADEINRASPKTQSSLLEIMEEHQTTVDGKTYKMPDPFIVIATQNPVEYTGTYPLPEAQLDRFFMCISIGYPSAEVESGMLTLLNERRTIENLSHVASAQELIMLQESVGKIFVDKKINDYIIEIITNTRRDKNIILGASPRASLCLYKAAQAWAMYNQREYVCPDDVIKMSVHVLSHRLILNPEAKFKKITAGSVIRESVEKVRVPF